MAAKQKTYSFHHLVLLGVLFLPMLVTYSRYKNRDSDEDLSYNKPNLTGIVVSDVKPELTRENWFSGTYQKEMDDYDNDHWAFKESMVRLNNQVYFNLFNQIRVNGFVMGKDNYVFSEGYIFSAFGDDLLRERKVDSLMAMARVIQDSLQRKGISLIVGFAPGKGAYCLDFVEDKYRHPVSATNYSNFLKYGKKYGLNVLDLQAHFNDLKKTTPYPLFTRFGHHWSYYGECVATQYLVNYVEHLRGEDLPDLVWNKVEVVDTARSRDADILKSMNLLHNPPQNMQLAYPTVRFESDSGKSKTRLLAIGDSYWYGQVYMGVPQNCFNGGEFWYYYNKVIPRRTQGVNTEVWELDLKQEIESFKVVMLLYSDGNLSSYGNRFIYDAYELYTSPETYYEKAERNRLIQTYAKQIRETPQLLKKATAMSNDLQIPLDSAIRHDAMKLAGLIKD